LHQGGGRCPRIEAILGTRTCLIGDFATPDEAEAFADLDQGYQDAEVRIEVLSPGRPL
jgi:hypothetical protein